MKSIILISVLGFLISGQIFACSEAGPHDFDISSNVEKTCSNIALKYASVFAKKVIQIESTEKGYDGPVGSLKSSSKPGLYTTKNRNGNSKLIGFHVGFKSKNKWDCDYCVEMQLDEKSNCRIESIFKHMCTK
jgi:hypothetical protein